MSINRMLYCKLCREQTPHSVLKIRTVIRKDRNAKHEEVVEEIVYSKICPNHKYRHERIVEVSPKNWKALLKAGKNWKA